MSSAVRRHLPVALVVVAIASILTISYASVILAVSSSPKAAWATNPVSITFAASAGTSSVQDSVTCSPTANSIQILAKTSSPSNMELTASPSSIASCSSSPSSIMITATCMTATPAACTGSYSGQLQLRQPANYRNLPEVLKVLITVS